MVAEVPRIYPPILTLQLLLPDDLTVRWRRLVKVRRLISGVAVSHSSKMIKISS